MAHAGVVTDISVHARRIHGDEGERHRMLLGSNDPKNSRALNDQEVRDLVEADSRRGFSEGVESYEWNLFWFPHGDTVRVVPGMWVHMLLPVDFINPGKFTQGDDDPIAAEDGRFRAFLDLFAFQLKKTGFGKPEGAVDLKYDVMRMTKINPAPPQWVNAADELMQSDQVEAVWKAFYEYAENYSHIESGGGEGLEELKSKGIVYEEKDCLKPGEQSYWKVVMEVVAVHHDASGKLVPELVWVRSLDAQCPVKRLLVPTPMVHGSLESLHIVSAASEARPGSTTGYGGTIKMTEVMVQHQNYRENGTATTLDGSEGVAGDTLYAQENPIMGRRAAAAWSPRGQQLARSDEPPLAVYVSALEYPKDAARFCAIAGFANGVIEFWSKEKKEEADPQPQSADATMPWRSCQRLQLPSPYAVTALKGFTKRHREAKLLLQVDPVDPERIHIFTGQQDGTVVHLEVREVRKVTRSHPDATHLLSPIQVYRVVCTGGDDVPEQWKAYVSDDKTNPRPRPIFALELVHDCIWAKGSSEESTDDPIDLDPAGATIAVSTGTHLLHFLLSAYKEQEDFDTQAGSAGAVFLKQKAEADEALEIKNDEKVDMLFKLNARS